MSKLHPRTFAPLSLADDEALLRRMARAMAGSDTGETDEREGGDDG
ncbi:MAG: hypothetical protein KHZ24_10145 [Coriobacteriia bacterium]|nr:hypothetical protein [Coriobacteriia bacterium]